MRAEKGGAEYYIEESGASTAPARIGESDHVW